MGGKATFAYTQAYEVLRRSLGSQHHLTKQFERSTRCPHRVKQPAKPDSARAMTSPKNARLPNIPSCGRRSAAKGHVFHGYDLDARVFAPWPPPTTTQEEHLWYAMAASPGGKRYGSQLHRQQQLQGEALATQVRNKIEPTLDALANSRTSSR